MLFVSISLKMMQCRASFTLLMMNESQLAYCRPPTSFFFFLTYLTLDLGESWSPLDVLWESFAQMENNFCICCQASGNRFAYFFIIFPHLNLLYFSFTILSAFCLQNNPLVNIIIN